MSQGQSTVPPLVVMGVQGSGKSTIGRLLAERIGTRFVDGDDLHSPENKAKMASGHPLTDRDRKPWLESIGDVLASDEPGKAIIVACSALKRAYRDIIRSRAPHTAFIHLEGPQTLIAERLAGRDHEYMPTSLLDSQFATLEPLEKDEAGCSVDLTLSPDDITDTVVGALLPGTRTDSPTTI